MEKRVSNVIIEQLIQENVRYVFGVTGKTISTLLDAILDYKVIEFVSAKHEAGGALMAYGYAQASGTTGVCCGSTGGGSTNLATGVATAYMNSVPLLVITGQIPTSEFGKGGFQESTGFGQSIDTVNFFKSITKESFSLMNPEKVAETIRYAIRSATSGRMGPVHVNIPLDVQQAKIEYHSLIQEKKFLYSGFFFGDEAMQQSLDLISNASKPVFLVGWGGVLSGANSEIIQIAESLKIPIATTIQGKGAIPGNHPLCLGIVGICGHPVAMEYVFEKADLVIAVGTSFSEFSTLGWDDRFPKNKNIIQIDIDSREIGKNYAVQVGLVGDAKAIVNQLGKKIGEAKLKAKKSGIDAEHFIKQQGRLINSQMMDDNSVPIKPQRLMKEVRDHIPQDTFLLADSSSHWAWAMHYLSVGEGGGFFPTLSLGAMGASISSAIGVKLSCPDKTVICICGDGSFLMGGNEVATAAQYNVAVIWILFNDARYNMPGFSMQKQFNRTIGVTLSETNFAKLAEAYNVKGYRVEKPDELPMVLTEALALNKPVVIDVVIDASEIPPLGKRKLIEEA